MRNDVARTYELVGLRAIETLSVVYIYIYTYLKKEIKK